MAYKASALKEEGNAHFTNGEYVEAEECYTQAILRDPSNPKLFTNRAMTHIKLQAWDACLNDCLKAIDLDPNNMKAYYHLAQAQLALKHPNEAYNSAMTAYERCVKTRDQSIQNASALVLQAKRLKWEIRERERAQQKNSLLRELEGALVRDRDEELNNLKYRRLDSVAEREERADIERSTHLKIEELYCAFAAADPEKASRKQPPDHLVDNVTFSVMHDPYITKSGVSYDKSTLIEHLKRSPEDPLTREPLRIEDLRPNRNLKAACDEYLEENGWAVDW